MTSIALSGTGTKKVVLKTINGVQKVSCSCCGCASVPDEISVVFSGITLCPYTPTFPATLVSVTLTRGEDGGFHYDDGTHAIDAECWSPSYISQFFPQFIPDIPAGIDPNGSTPIFSIYYYAPEGGTGGGPDQDGDVFGGRFLANGTSLNNFYTFSACSGRDNWAYGGTATLSWEI